MKRRQKQKRRGTIAIMSAVLAIVMLAMVAFSVDVGYVLTAKEELQRTADASALAACWDYGKSLSKGQTYTVATQTARTSASTYASYNQITKNPTQIDTNTSNSPGGDVVFGYISDLGGAANNFQTGTTTNYNAIQVRVRKDATLNGKVPYFFARIFGMQGQSLTAQATAAMVRDVSGFKAPADGSNIDLLPFALDLQTFNGWVAGSGDDAWKWDPATKKVVAGSDGVLEVNLYPQGTGSPGNRGTVDIGSSNNSTADIARQIVYGISAHDLSYLGGKIEFDANGELQLNGDTGISAGVKDELASIIGKPRVIPIFSKVQGPGNNAQYTIVKWFGIRIMDVQLTGAMSKKHVTIQAAPLVVRGVVSSPTTGTSAYVYSPVVLVK
jgi:Flp pilus assembly protein TadG